MSSHLYLLSNFKIFKEVFERTLWLRLLGLASTSPTLSRQAIHCALCHSTGCLDLSAAECEITWKYSILWWSAIYKMQDTLVYLNLLDIVSLGIGSCIASKYFISFNYIWKATIDFNWQSLVRLSAWRIRFSIVDPSYHSKAYGNLRNSAPLALDVKYHFKLPKLSKQIM